MRSSVKLLSALLAAAMLLPSQAMAAELAPAAEPAALTAETPQTGYEVTFQAQRASVDVFYMPRITRRRMRPTLPMPFPGTPTPAKSTPPATARSTSG